MKPMTPLEASATVINSVLGTGPFTYPFVFVQLSPTKSILMLATMCFVSYVTATFMVEAISVVNAMDLKKRRFPMFGENIHETPEVKRKAMSADDGNKTNPYYIRKKIEVGVLAERLAPNWIKTTFFIMTTLLIYGALCLTYVAGAKSFVNGLNSIFWPND